MSGSWKKKEIINVSQGWLHFPVIIGLQCGSE